MLGIPDSAVAIGSPPTKVTLEVTKFPVVFMAGDPVAAGFAESLAKPGRNATGLSVVYTELVTKQTDLLHELIPRARRIGRRSAPGAGARTRLARTPRRARACVATGGAG